MTSYFVVSKTKTFEYSRVTTFNPVSDINYILPLNHIQHHIANGLFEEKLIEWSRQFCNKDKVFLDIGSHTGTYALSLSQYCKYVHAFEPQKMTYYALCGSVALSNINNIECHNYGLGSEEQVGEQTLKIVSIDGGGSSLHSTAGIIGEEQITIKTLDSLNIDNIGFIKMDIEENELYALQGAVETIKRCNNPPILFECNTINEKLFTFITSLDYRIINISGFSHMFLAIPKL
jgi:FkbM family methyltransferase